MDQAQYYPDSAQSLAYLFQSASVKDRGPCETLVIFIHGFPDNAYTWWHLWGGLPEFNRMAPFLPGTAPGSSLKKNFEQEYQNKVLLEKMLGVLLQIPTDQRKKIVIIAHDLGGGLQESLAKTFDQGLVPHSELHSLVLVNTLSPKMFVNRIKENNKQRKKSWYMLLFQLPVLNARFLSPFYSKLLNIVERKGRPKDAAIEAYTGPETLHGLSCYRSNLKAILKKQKEINKSGKGDIPRGIRTTPTLFLWGRRDPFLVTPTEKEMARYFTNFKIHTLDLGHWPFIEQPNQMLSVLRPFLEKQNL